MEGVVGNLLMLARLDSGSDEFNVGDINPAALLRQCWKPFFESAEVRELKVQWNIKGCPESFRGSPSLFKIMFTNLMDNAVSYAPQGGCVQIESYTEGSSLVISIINTNPGVTESDLANLFERFHRGDASASGGVGHAGSRL